MPAGQRGEFREVTNQSHALARSEADLASDCRPQSNMEEIIRIKSIQCWLGPSIVDPYTFRRLSRI